jgi:hypothetical protein
MPCYERLRQPRAGVIAAIRRGGAWAIAGTVLDGGCYRPRYLNIQRLNYLWTIRHSSARVAGNLIT